MTELEAAMARPVNENELKIRADFQQWLKDKSRERKEVL